MATSREIHLAARPHGVPQPTDFALVEVDVPEPADGRGADPERVHVGRPVMRRRMNDVKSYLPPFQVGEAMSGGAVGPGRRVAQRPRRPRDRGSRTGSAGASSRSRTGAA